MKNIMFICTGNTCRSAMAQAFMKKLLKDKNDVKVYSAGIYAINGEKASYEAIKTLKDYYDTDLSMHKSTNVRDSKIKQMDLILCATISHAEMLKRMYPELKEKIFTIKEYAYGKEVEDKDIKDPWGYTLDVYKNCAKEIYEALEKIVEKTQQK